MIIGVPKEIKPDEYRVGMVPVGVEVLKKAGHKIIIEKGAGLGSAVTDRDYKEAGAEIVPSARDIYRKADMLIKVKEPLEKEYNLLKSGQIVFTFFHFAANETLTRAMVRRKIVAIAYETISTDEGSIPLLIPMSEVAGRMAIQEGAKYLERPMMGKGILLGGVPGVPPANVVIIGGGVVGSNAAKIAAGLKARVTIMDINLDRLRYLDDIMPSNVVTMMSNTYNIRQKLKEADLLIGAVLILGAKAPVLVTRKMLKLMKPGSVIVDVAVDQGGCVETIRPTTHQAPVYIVDNIVHYGVANMPGAVAGTSTYALTNATLHYAVEIANKGYEKAAKENKAIARGINMVEGRVTLKPIALQFGFKHHTLN